MKYKGLRKFDVVEVVTSRYQEEPNFATILELTEYHGEDAAIIQYHNNSCAPQKVCVQYMEKHCR